MISALQLLPEGGHSEGGVGKLGAAVDLAPAAILGLAAGIGDDDAVDHRSAAGKGNGLEGVGDTVADHLMVIGVAPDQDTEGDGAVGATLPE
jgi:hypothetical protein